MGKGARRRENGKERESACFLRLHTCDGAGMMHGSVHGSLLYHLSWRLCGAFILCS